MGEVFENVLVFSNFRLSGGWPNALDYSLFHPSFMVRMKIFFLLNSDRFLELHPPSASGWLPFTKGFCCYATHHGVSIAVNYHACIVSLLSRIIRSFVKRNSNFEHLSWWINILLLDEYPQYVRIEENMSAMRIKNNRFIFHLKPNIGIEMAFSKN